MKATVPLYETNRDNIQQSMTWSRGNIQSRGYWWERDPWGQNGHLTSTFGIQSVHAYVYTHTLHTHIFTHTHTLHTCTCIYTHPTYPHTYTHPYTCENAHATDIHKQSKRRRGRVRKDLLKKIDQKHWKWAMWWIKHPVESFTGRMD